jgi:Electron transfer DM13
MVRQVDIMKSFWKSVSIFLLGGVLGTAFGIAVGFFIFPYVFPPPPAAESLTDADRSRLVASGMFIHANPADPVQWGRGKVSVYERTVFLEDDFKVGPGPKYHVYLVPKVQVRSEADVKSATPVDLGRLRSFEGSQRYPIPNSVKLDDYRSVVIWCEQFGVLISPADLMRSGS